MNLPEGEELNYPALLTVTAVAEGSVAVHEGHTAPAGNWAGNLLKNSAANVVRIGLTSLIAILLPIYLTHHLSIQVYGAWILILQISAYVSYLNLGVQTALAKFVAEYRTKLDNARCNECVSAGLLIMLVATLLGMLLTCVLVFFIPRLFPNMPGSMLHEVRLSVFIVGISVSIGLATSVFSGIFLGLERYNVPMVLTVCSRVLYAVVICMAVGFHRGLVTMASASAGVALLTSAGEVLAWRKFAPFIHISMRTVSREMLKRMIAYCSILTVWTACMLFIGGLDITIVGHYAFHQVAFYSIGNSPNNLILMVIGALLGPLLPATSAYSVKSSALQMGEMLLRITRYSTLMLLGTGLPVIVGGYLLLRVWVGQAYASHSVIFLQVLLLANIIRNLAAPYSTLVVATSRQRVGTASAVSEAVINLSCSIVLAQHLGAIGVALGTLIGAVAGVAMHFGVTMHYTRVNFDISRLRLFVGGLLRPASMALPTILLIPLWWGGGRYERFNILIWFAWASSTGLLFWYGGMLGEDRALLLRFLERLRTRLRTT